MEKEFSRKNVKDFVVQMLTRMMPDHKELHDLKGNDIYEAIEFGQDKADQLQRLVYLRAISEIEQRIDEFVNKKMK